MRRVFALVIMLLFGTASYGAVSDDVYVRRDVFEVYMQNLTANQERILQKLDNLEGKISDMSDRLSNLSGRVDGLDKRIDELDKRIDDLRNGIYLWMVAIGLVISWPKVQNLLQKFGNSTPSITLEDIERLIDRKLSELPRS